MKLLLKLIVLGMLAFSAHQAWSNWPVKHGPGAIVQFSPQRYAIAEPDPFDLDGLRITRLETFDGKARVLEVKSYWRGNRADLGFGAPHARTWGGPSAS